MAREEDAYDASALVIPEWRTPLPAGDDGGETEAAAPITLDDELRSEAADVPVPHVHADVQSLPSVGLRHDLVPLELSPARFFTIMVDTVLGNTPVNMHVEARRRPALG